MLIRRGVGDQNLLHAVELGGGVGGCFAILTGDEDVHVAAHRLGGGQRLQGRVLDSLVVVFGGEERAHSPPASYFSLQIISATEPTLTPDLRPGGSAVFSTCSRGLMSTP